MENGSRRQVDWREIRAAILQGVVAGILLALAFAGGFLFRDQALKPPTSQTSFALLNEADALLAQHFLYDLPGESIRVHGAVSGLVTSLNDPYTFFVEPQTADVDSTNLAGRFGGIGVEIARDEQGHFVITRVYRDNPAYEAGLQEGDIILAVDGMVMDTSAADSNQVLAAVRGDVGTKVTLTILRGDEIFDVEMTRTEVLIPSTFWRVLEQDPRVGYVQIARFTDRAPEEVRQAISDLEAQNVSAYILDLRDNGGGLVDAAVRIAGEFLDGGVVLYEERQGNQETVYNAPQGGSALQAPLVVLTNQGTASASEILAGALRDRGRATLIGQRTFGKGTVQLILPLSDGSSIHVTTAQWLTPSRQPIEGQGLTPDTIVEPIEGQDAILEAALEYLADQLRSMEPTGGQGYHVEHFTYVQFTEEDRG